ncbi:MAG: tRNA (adenosine(37)-N6)-threonylcarbamoyltransferase complex dimerization subunit type 1 TsaB [Synechococcus sp.]|nr:tRNA (adenosine(37)-N6)-threonylcarbamoyltransferase complex dimerization subunit type 1 TsaB [Synechococcus sp.]
MSRWVLAMHSSTPVLGVAVVDLDAPETSRLVLTRPAGRELTNGLPGAVQEALPASQWPSIVRLAVATGPGGFTGTRLTVVMARTLAQQLGCPLDGVSSFALMAPRLVNQARLEDVSAPFWILQALPRRGQVGGLYRIDHNQDVVELTQPHLLKDDASVTPALTMVEDVAMDVERLLDLCCAAHHRQLPAPWSTVLPIYPTSPVGEV